MLCGILRGGEGPREKRLKYDEKTKKKKEVAWSCNGKLFFLL